MTIPFQDIMHSYFKHTSNIPLTPFFSIYSYRYSLETEKTMANIAQQAMALQANLTNVGYSPDGAGAIAANDLVTIMTSLALMISII
jgi:hypothetical protein